MIALLISQTIIFVEMKTHQGRLHEFVYDSKHKTAPAQNQEENKDH